MATETTSYDNLFAGDFPVVTEKVTIASGEGKLTRGTILGVVTASGKYAAADSTDTGNDASGTATPKAVLLSDVDATSADVEGADVAFTGEFAASALVAKTGSTVAGFKEGLRAVSIFVKDAI